MKAADFLSRSIVFSLFLCVMLGLALVGCPETPPPSEGEGEGEGEGELSPPVAAFDGNPTTGTVPLTVQFTDESTSDGKSITSWSWDFGDGDTSTAQNPSHTYASVGSYTVSLTVENSDGQDTATKADFITVSPEPVGPDAAFSASPTSGPAPLTVTFTDESDPGTSSITSWEWDFGDGQTSSEQNPSHSYQESGTYSVELTVTTSVDSDRTTRSRYIRVTVARVAVPDVVGMTRTAAESTLQNAGLVVGSVSEQYSDTVSSGAVISQSIQPGNEVNEGTTINLVISKGSEPEPPPSGGGGGDDGGGGSQPIGPTAAFSADKTTGPPPLTVQFTDSSSSGSASITSWLWDFGDGVTSTQQSPSHSYDSEGTYSVSLTVTTSVSSDTETKTNYITVTSTAVGPTAAFSADTTAGDAPLTVQFTDSSSSGSASITSWLWDFGDGGTSTQQSPSHSYAGEGTYSVSLTVTTSVSSDTETKTNYITVSSSAIPDSVNLVKWQVEASAPNYVNILFQALDEEGVGVTNMVTENFEVLEDGLSVSPTESYNEIMKRDQLPYTFYTVLMLDVSSSVGANLAEIKAGAAALVNIMTLKQQIAVYKFSEQAEMVIDFTGIDGKQDILDAIDSIQLGFPTTNLYGAAITGVEQFTDLYQVSGITQGALVLFTDGSDTTGLYSLQNVLDARGSKRVYTIGAGAEIDPSALQSLGNAGYYSLGDFTQLETTFATIQSNIDAYANSFYLLRYNSPKRGSSNHDLSVYTVPPIVSNTITGSFNSADFYSVMPGIYINDSTLRPEGITEVAVGEGQETVTLEAHSYYGTPGIAPVFEWTIDDIGIADFAFANGNQVGLTGVAPGDTTLTVEDTANGFSLMLSVTVVEDMSILLPGDVPLEMVYIPGGTFMMGRYPGEQDSYSDEDPQHSVTVPGFWMGKYEVTQAQWEAVMGSNPSYFSGANRPVERVSWNDAKDFIAALNSQTGKTFRLPSEAEWEYACRAGATTRFYWGDDPDYTAIGNYAWYDGNSGSETHDVGGKLPNAWGLYDMSGNVWEWCEDDWHGDYTGAPTDGSAWVDSPRADNRVLRGGSWYNYDRYCRFASRSWGNLTIANILIGFRVVCAP